MKDQNKISSLKKFRDLQTSLEEAVRHNRRLEADLQSLKSQNLESK